MSAASAQPSSEEIASSTKELLAALVQAKSAVDNLTVRIAIYSRELLPGVAPSWSASPQAQAAAQHLEQEGALVEEVMRLRDALAAARAEIAALKSDPDKLPPGAAPGGAAVTPAGGGEVGLTAVGPQVFTTSSGQAAVCKDGGPYCPYLNAALDAGAEGGLKASTLVKTTTLASREVITHSVMVDGRKRELILGFCPFCRGELELRRVVSGAAPTLVTREAGQ